MSSESECTASNTSPLGKAKDFCTD
jgi:hypothetical protein